MIVAGPDIGLPWLALWEHKAVNAKSWTDIVKHGLRATKPLYFAQVQVYMAYMDVGVTLFTALNKDNQALCRARWLYTAITRAERGLVLLD